MPGCPVFQPKAIRQRETTGAFELNTAHTGLIALINVLNGCRYALGSPRSCHRVVRCVLLRLQSKCLEVGIFVMCASVTHRMTSSTSEMNLRIERGTMNLWKYRIARVWRLFLLLLCRAIESCCHMGHQMLLLESRRAGGTKVSGDIGWINENRFP
jgi:hypothetical protein